MNPHQAGFLLLTSHLGDPQAPVLSPAQLRSLTQRVRSAATPEENRAMLPEDLTALGFDRDFAVRVIALLNRTEQLQWYLNRGKQLGCTPISRSSPEYPNVLREKLGPEAPGCLWAKGDLSLLKRPCVSLAGSRNLLTPNRAFAAEAGRQAALQGFTLVSGGAKGADTAAQEACLAAGGSVICVLPDRLDTVSFRSNLLFLSEEDFDLPFSAQRALSRNRVIHALGRLVFVAQSAPGTGGTWSGTAWNLHRHISPVFCFQDGSQAMAELIAMGADGIGMQALSDFSRLQPSQIPFF